MYDTTVVKTLDTHVSSVGAKAQEDGLQLTEMKKKGTTKSIESMDCGPSESGSCEK
jgi:hypothetical protein